MSKGGEEKGPMKRALLEQKENAPAIDIFVTHVTSLHSHKGRLLPFREMID